MSRPDAKHCGACGARQPSTPTPQRTTLLARPRLVVSWLGRTLASRELDKDAITIGRWPDNDIVLTFSGVSRHHARLERHGAGYKIVDLNSTNGVIFQGQRITEKPLVDGDTLRISDGQGDSITLVYHGVSVGQARPPPVAVFSLAGRSSVRIGRDPACDLRLDHPTVSRQHARLDVQGHQHVLLDLGSTNGTFVNGQPIQRLVLPIGARVQIGAYELIYDGATITHVSQKGRIHLDAVGLHREVRGDHRLQRARTCLQKGEIQKALSVLWQGDSFPLLRDISLAICPREFVALVGGSGTGKTTLLNALSGFQRAAGRVLINGDDYYANFDAYRTLVGYVPQADIVHLNLPVARALRYAAQLRLPDLSPAEVDARIERALRAVDIWECRERLVCQLSGGQRKRVSIAMELLAEPSLFFLDEPTSGLDPGLEKKLMYTLRDLADQEERTIVLVTHATANIDRCHQVAFLGQGGRLVFFGPPQEVRSFFQAGDFPDIYNEIERDPGHWEQQFRASPYYQQYIEQRRHQATGSGHSSPAASVTPQVSLRARALAICNPQQLWVLVRRYFELICRDTRNLLILLLQAPVIALLLLLVAEEDDLVANVFAAQRIVFVLASAAVWFGIINSAREITKETSIYRRERMVNLGLIPYVLSKIIVLLVLCLVQSLALLFVLGLKVEFPSQGVLLSGPLEMYVTVVLTTLAGLALGLCISALVSNEDKAMSVVPIILIPQIIFAGMVFKLEGAGEAISWLTLSRWALEALGATVDLNALKAFVPGPAELNFAYRHTAGYLLSRWAALGLYTVGLTALTCWLQRRKDVH
ncbi:MAG: FHA domain-containing protein [Anaerolineae bacterium]|nr:FHA domain-containing protein [Anaerolineae bacterium]